MSVGSPPCHATITWGVRCDSSNCRIYCSSVASDIRCLSFGYSASLDRKKQYVQSMLQVDPLGLASRWKPGGDSPGAAGPGKRLQRGSSWRRPQSSFPECTVGRALSIANSASGGNRRYRDAMAGSHEG